MMEKISDFLFIHSDNELEWVQSNVFVLELN